MTTSTLTSKSQATIPKTIRDVLGVKPGSRIAFEVRDREVIVRATTSPAGMLRAFAKGRDARGARNSVGRHLGLLDEKSRAR